MIGGRLTTGVAVSALIRRVNAEGGAATVLRKGDPTAGAVILSLCERGRNGRLFERVLGDGGSYVWRPIGPPRGAESDTLAAFIEKRVNFDPDIWIVELDIPQPERFIDELIVND